MRYLKKFEKFLIVEKIEADKITVYHRTKYEKPEDFKLGFKVEVVPTTELAFIQLKI
jgi:hypothetical protein